MFRNQNGQIGVWTIVGVGASAIIAFSGSLLLQNNLFSSKVDAVNGNLVKVQVDIGKLQTQSEQYQKDIENINKKLDQILMKLK